MKKKRALSRRHFLAATSILAGSTLVPCRSIAKASDSAPAASNAISWTSWAARTIYWFIRKVSNSYYSVQAGKTVQSNNVRVSSGSIEYNNGTNGPSSYIDVAVSSPYSGTPNIYVSVSVSTDFLTGLTDVMAVTLTNPSGSYVINTTLGINGSKGYSVRSSGAQGTYRATYSITNRKKWTGEVWVYDYNAPSSYAETFSDRVFSSEHNKYYLISSKRENMVFDTRLAQNEGTINVDELYEQFWDPSLNEYVYLLNDYRVGFLIRVEDDIEKLVFDEEKNRTIFEFCTRRGTAYWPFEGDLRDRFSAGDSIAFSLQVVEEYADGKYQFETLNYFKAAENKLFDEALPLQIDDYLAV